MAIAYLIGCSLLAQMVKNLPATQETWVWSLGCEDPLEKEMETHSSILPGESHGQRSLVGYKPWAPEESDTTEGLSRHTYIWQINIYTCPAVSTPYYTQHMYRFTYTHAQVVLSNHAYFTILWRLNKVINIKVISPTPGSQQMLSEHGW